MKVLIKSETPNFPDQEFAIEEHQTKVIGRRGSKDGEHADVPFSDPHMSRLHFRIVNQGEYAEFEDCGARNKTFHNNHVKKGGILADGDTLKAGRTTFTVKIIPAKSIEEPESLRPEPPTAAADMDGTKLGDESSMNVRRPSMFEGDSSFGVPPGRANEGRDQMELGGEVIDPFGDSIELPRGGPASKKQPVIERSFLLLSRPTEEEAADGFSQLLDAISHQWVIRLVLHFMKIRMSPPRQFQDNGSLFGLQVDWSQEPAGPIVVSWDDIKAEPHLLELLPRMCRNDACLALIGTSAEELNWQIPKMLRQEVSGFSEEDGFLPCCWPSTFATIIDCAGKSICEKLFGDAISGAYFCSPFNKRQLVVVAETELSRHFMDRRFVETSRVMG